MSEAQDPKIANFTPRGLEEPKDQNRMAIKSFTPASFNQGEIKHYSKVKETFGSLASTDEKANSHFNLHPDSKKLLGVDQEERSHLESIISKEVNERLSLLRDMTIEEAKAEGLRLGKAEAETKMSQKFQPLWDNFMAITQEFDNMKQEMYAANEKVLIQMIFNIGKQVMLRELKTDPEYLKRLTVQLIEKIGIRDHLKVKVSKHDQDNIDELKDFLKGHYVDLKNIQIEPSDEVQVGGCKIETNLIRIDASLENQFQAIEDSLKET